MLAVREELMGFRDSAREIERFEGAGNPARRLARVVSVETEDFNALVRYAASEAVKSIGHEDEQ